MDEDKFLQKLREALTYDGQDRPALIARIPVICNDIRDIKTALIRIETNYTWMKWIGGGFVIAAGMLALKALGLHGV